MRGSDVVDLLLEVLPKAWVRTALVLVVGLMVLTHWYEPVVWYIVDKAQGFTQLLLPALQEWMQSVVTTPVSG